VVAIN